MHAHHFALATLAAISAASAIFAQGKAGAPALLSDRLLAAVAWPWTAVLLLWLGSLFGVGLAYEKICKPQLGGPRRS